MTDNHHNLITRRHGLLILVTFSIVIIFSGLMFIRMQKKKIIAEKELELNAIISLKVRDISEWRKEHFRDARILGENAGFADLVKNLLNKSIEESKLSSILFSIIQDYDYHSIFITDTNNIIRFSSSSSDKNIIGTKYISAAPGTADLQLSADSSTIVMDITATITDVKGRRIGTLILRIDPEIKLFPHIQTWPTSSRTSETLLLRREGDKVIYLNELRHLKGTALKFRLAASDPALPAARALSGYEGFFEGRDYRGVKVASFVRKIPDSPWYMVAKIDKAEIYSPLLAQGFLIMVIVLLTIVTFSIILRLYFRNQRIKYLNEISQTRDKLYSIISHDLKNPFVSIMGFSELLYERSLKNDSSKTGEYASIIYSSSRNAMDLLHNLTGWTKIQTGRTFYNPKEVDIVKLVHEIVEFSNSSALIKSITINADLPAELKMKADKEMIGTILRNLIHNAIKFSFKESTIIITAALNRNMVEIEVSDSGIGMDEQTVRRLSDGSFIDSTPGTSNEKGTGLGLYICREFIAFHKGTLEIISEPGNGSRFIVRVPDR